MQVVWTQKPRFVENCQILDFIQLRIRIKKVHTTFLHQDKEMVPEHKNQNHHVI